MLLLCPCFYAGIARLAPGVLCSQRAFSSQGGAGGQAAKSDGGGVFEDKPTAVGKKFGSFVTEWGGWLAVGLIIPAAVVLPDGICVACTALRYSWSVPSCPDRVA